MVDQEKREFVERNVKFLKEDRNTYPHHFDTNLPGDRGCRICGQGPGALQHNYYLVKDYEEMKNESSQRTHP